MRLTDEARGKYLKQLRVCEVNFDTEMAHANADDILCEVLRVLGYEDIVEAWNKVDKWYA